MVAPALASEGAEYLAKDSKYESARIGGAALSRWGSESLAREIETPGFGNALSNFNNRPVVSTPFGYPTLNQSSPMVQSLPEGRGAARSEYSRQKRFVESPLYSSSLRKSIYARGHLGGSGISAASRHEFFRAAAAASSGQGRRGAGTGRRRSPEQRRQRPVRFSVASGASEALQSKVSPWQSKARPCCDAIFLESLCS
jgi:hypothetical protein